MPQPVRNRMQGVSLKASGIDRVWHAGCGMGHKRGRGSGMQAAAWDISVAERAAQDAEDRLGRPCAALLHVRGGDAGQPRPKWPRALTRAKSKRRNMAGTSRVSRHLCELRHTGLYGRAMNAERQAWGCMVRCARRCPGFSCQGCQ